MTRIVSGLFGGKSKSEGILQRFRPTGFNTAGATGSMVNGSFQVSPTAARTTAVQDVVAGLRGRGQAFGGLREQVTPGFGRLTQIRQEGLRTRLSALRGERTRAVGNVREQLARRRLQGSSFQASEVSRAESMFAREEDALRADANQQEAEAFIQELGLNAELITQEFGSRVEAAMTVLNDLNFDTQVAAASANQISGLMAANLTAQAEARAAQQQAGEDFLGTVLGMFSFGGK